jgi:hypothetical protein
MEISDNANAESEQTIYPGDILSDEYASGFNNWSNWGNGPSDPGRSGGDITANLD